MTKQEDPHSVAVVVESMKRDAETDKVHIRATIMVERDSQKRVLSSASKGPCSRKSAKWPAVISNHLGRQGLS